MEHNGAGSFDHFWFSDFWLNKKLIPRAKNTENVLGHVGHKTTGITVHVELTQRDGTQGGMSQCGTTDTELIHEQRIADI